MPQNKYDRYVIILIIVFAIIRFVPAFILELGNDEAYYWLYGQQLQWNYFDHPPLVALWVRVFTFNGLFDNYEGMVRAGSIFSCAFSTWFMYKTISLIKDSRAGWYGAILFNASLYTGIVAGVLLMPDSPQLFFWTLSLWQIARIVRDQRKTLAWVWFGMFAGLAVMSKVHGVFLWSGVGLYAILCKREWFRQPMPYVSFAITLLIASPIWLWNVHYDFITWKFHSARIDVFATGPANDGFLLELAEQVLINNPVNVLLITLSFIAAWRTRAWQPAIVIYNLIAFPLIISLLVISVSREVWFHWSGPAYTSLLPMAAIWLTDVNKVWLRRALRWSTAFFIAAIALWPTLIMLYPGTYGSQQKESRGNGDITLDKYGWEKAGEIFSSVYEQEARPRADSQPIPIVCPTWWGAHLEYYFARPVDAPVIGLGSTAAVHQYAWLNEQRLAGADMDTAFYIVSTIEDTISPAFYQKYYRHQELLTTIPVYRRGHRVADFHVLRLSGWKGNATPVAELPSASE